MAALGEIRKEVPRVLVLLAGLAWAASISTVLFALVYTQYDLWGWISVGLTGAAACYMTLRTGSLKSAIVMPALTNLHHHAGCVFPLSASALKGWHRRLSPARLVRR
jgi:hypothetical protein